MSTKITKTERFNAIKAQLSDPELIAFVESEIALIAKRKAHKVEGPTKAQLANQQLAEEVLNHFKAAGTGTKFLTADVAGVFNASTQKMAPILNGLADAGKLVKTVDKRKSYFSLV